MLSQYPVLDNKPIDQWRVTELREELRKRSLATKGLKEELVKRLDEAIQKEKQSENEVELGNGVEPNSDLQNNINEEDVELEGADNTQPLLDVDDNIDNDASMVNINHGVVDVNQESTGRNGDVIEVACFVGIDEENASTTDDVEGNVAVKKNVATSHSGMQDEDAELEELKPPICGIFEEKEATTGDLEGIAPVNQNITAQSGMQDEDAEPEKFEEMKPPIAEADEEKAVITGDFESSAPVSQDVTAQSGKQGEDAKPVDKFDESMPPIVETDEMAATTGEFEGSALINQNITSQSGMQGEDAEPEEKFEELKTLTVDSTVIQSKQSNQVSEISQDLGFQVKYESNSTDSVSINEKNYIKDNLSADNFPLELEVVKQEVVQSSSNSYPTGGDSCMAVDEEEAAKYHAIAEQEGVKNEVSDGQEVGQNLLSDEQEANDINVANGQYLLQNYDSCQQEAGEEPVFLKDVDTQNASTVLPKKEDCVEAGSPEKLNLDRSSGDESMEEDVLESKHMEVDIKFEEPTNKIEVKKVDAKLEEKVAADAVSKFSPEMKDVAVEDVKPAALTMKRKLGEADAGNNGAPKRHRRWNPDTIKVPEQQTAHLDIAMTPKNNTQPTPRRTFSRSNSALNVDSPKERIVPTSKKPATTSLRIDNFLRPFTLKAVQELLAQTGNVCDFWMDHIKTHCYVTYSSVEEAIETRNAVYNLQWPPNGGRLLSAEFVDPQEVKSRLEVPPQSPVATPKAPSPIKKTQAPQPTLQQNLRLQPLPPPPLTHPPPPPPPLLSIPPPIAREQRLPPPPPKMPDPPVVTLDDLFKKTKATPRIYYLPLTEEQVAAKLAAQGKRKQV